MDKKFDLKKIKLIVGLGNKGDKFKLTRHNIGFLFLDFLAEESFREEKRFKALVSEILVNDSRVYLAKPMTMMNLSGDCVEAMANFYKIQPEEILVVHDDLDIIFGDFKIHPAKGPKVHNGINSIETKLSTREFWRLRLGIDGRTAETREFYTGKDYVLDRFNKEEEQELKTIFQNAKNLINE